jgi:hypothetical protein
MTSSLQDLFDAFLNGDCPPEAFLSELSAYCNATRDSSWEVLSLLDQYHRRGKLSADHFRAFRRRIELHALGIAEPAVAAAPVESIAAIAPIAPVADVTPAASAHDEDEVRKLRAALEVERERSQRYRRRIETLSEYGRQHRSTSRSCAMVVAPDAPVPSELVASAPAQTGAGRGKALVAAWLAQHRRLQHPRAWTSAAVLIAAVTVISGSSSNLGQASRATGVAITPVVFEPAPQLPAAIMEPRTISLASEKFVVLPGSSTATIQVDRTGEVGDAATFKWWTQSAGAKSGRDYIGKSQIAQFEAGQTSIQLPVRILANPNRKHTEMFYVVIGEPGDEATLIPNSRAAVFIMRAH